jgi:hypothetical protein
MRACMHWGADAHWRTHRISCTCVMPHRRLDAARARMVALASAHPLPLSPSDRHVEYVQAQELLSQLPVLFPGWSSGESSVRHACTEDRSHARRRGRMQAHAWDASRHRRMRKLYLMHAHSTHVRFDVHLTRLLMCAGFPVRLSAREERRTKVRASRSVAF